MPATSARQPSPAETRPGAPLDRRGSIIQAAGTVVGRDGYGATSIKHIAAEAGVAPGLVHYYFANKEELMVAVATRLGDEARQHWLTSGEGITDPIERIDAAITYIDQVRRTQPGFYRLVFDLYVAGFANPAIRARMREWWDQYVGLVDDELTNIFAALEVPCPVDSRSLASGVAATIDGIALMALANGHDPSGDYDALKAMLLSTLVAAHVAAGKPVPVERLRFLGGAVGER